MSIDREFELLKEYLDIKLQLTEYCFEFGGKRIYKSYLPTFEQFKEFYEVMTKPSLQEAKSMYPNGIIGNEYCGGLYVKPNTIANRFSNSWINCKYYTDGNVAGKYTLVYPNLKYVLSKTINLK